MRTVIGDTIEGEQRLDRFRAHGKTRLGSQKSLVFKVVSVPTEGFAAISCRLAAGGL